MIGRTISHYKILEKLGEGGMGEVYLAEDLELERKVAIKFLPEQLTQDKKNVERFQREAKTAAALNHTNIVTIYEIAQEKTQLFIVMEYVEGKTLQELISASSQFPVPNYLSIISQSCEGLSAAHQAEIVHRDLKPANILVTTNGIVKILDFGLAKLAGVQQLTKTGQVMGTILYMSPEQARGEEVDQQTDIWSMGVIMYELASGQLPFMADYEQAVIYSILNEEPKPLTSSKPDITKELIGIIQTALHKNPQKRYPDIDSLLSNLESLERKLNLKNGVAVGKAHSQIPSIAVLPFIDMSPQKDQEYFCEGISEELINGLTQLKDLRVAARTSSFSFKGRDSDIREIGNQLNVDTILEGSVRKAGNQLRITAQLINTDDGYHIWSERYDREMEDIFAIQDEITTEVIGKLKINLLKQSTPAGERRPADLEAYEWYLKGHYVWHKFSVEHIQEAVTCYKKAIETDPNFALAYAALAEIYIFQATAVSLHPSRESMPLARKLVEKSLELDPTLPEAHTALGMIATFYDWDSQRAKKSFNRAIELNPNSAGSYLWLEFPHSLIDQNFEEAHAVLRRSLELDPLNLLVRIRMGYIYYYQYEFDRAIEEFQKTLDVEPNFAMGHHGLIDAYGQKEMYDRAFEEGEKTLAASGRVATHIAVLAYYYGRAGKIEQCKKLLAELFDQAKRNFVSPVWIAVIYMGMGDFDAAFEYFARAFEQRDGNLLYSVAPPFDIIRKDPRFIQLRKNMGFYT
jgi:serine/threonine protein kinase/Tfp pilus assembly protein PilF